MRGQLTSVSLERFATGLPRGLYDEPMSRGTRCTVATLTLIAALAASTASSEAATVTLGRPNLLGTVPSEYYECSGCQSYAAVNLTPAAGRQLVAPADGQVTSWEAAGEQQEATLSLFSLHPNGDGSYTDGSITAATTTLDGSSIPTALTVLAGDKLAVYFVRTVDFAKSKIRLGVAPAAGASWGELGYFIKGHTETPFATPPDKELLYNATLELLAPGLTGIAPATGGAGTAVTIKGQHLAIATAVTFGGVPATGFSGDDEQITAIAPPHASGPVDVQVTTAGGTSIGLPLDVFTYPSPPPAPPKPDLLAPTVSTLGVSPASFKAANLGGSVFAARVGARVSYRLSEPATTTFTVHRALRGRRSGRRCVAPKPSNRSKRACTRYRSLPGSFTRKAVAGIDHFGFSGRLGGKALPPGRYRLVALARDAAGNRSKPAASTFKITR